VTRSASGNGIDAVQQRASRPRDAQGGQVDHVGHDSPAQPILDTLFDRSGFGRAQRNLAAAGAA
jgi:hypothetical protein